ncbi:MAG: VWA domain-containing protein [Candidatus Lokiarchaeota archaeon]|nr:VWA domain-containing protein [Candidatus Lokiarchaeota archaeon]
MAEGLPYSTISRLAETAIQNENLSALLGLAICSQRAVADTLSSKDGVELFSNNIQKSSEAIPELFFLLKKSFSQGYLPIFRRLTRNFIIKAAMRISGRGLRGDLKRDAIFEPGMSEFSVEKTIDRFLEKYSEDNLLTYKDIVGIEKTERRKTGVLMLDTSGSMYGEKMVNACLTVAVLSHHMQKDEYAVIIFNNDANVIKKIDAKTEISELIEAILDMEPAGYTNIEAALKKGLLELGKKRMNPRKWGILVTDGEYNKGGDPRPFARSFPKLHVIQSPSQSAAIKKGERLCKDLARYGKGRYAKVHSHSEIPRVLMNLLKKV